MSIELGLDVDRPVVIADWVRATQEFLICLTNFADVPKIQMLRVVKGANTQFCEKTIGTEEAVYSFSYVGREDQVWITICFLDTSNVGNFAISVENTYEPSEYALALSCALALARMANTQIQDAVGFWTGDINLGLSAIKNLLYVKINHNSYDEACANLLGNRLH